MIEQDVCGLTGQCSIIWILPIILYSELVKPQRMSDFRVLNTKWDIYTTPQGSVKPQRMSQKGCKSERSGRTGLLQNSDF